MRQTKQKTKKIAIVGAGMAGITAARTLIQAGHDVVVFEKSKGTGGRMSTRRSDFGSFDHGAQYFTVRDKRFSAALKWAQSTAPGVVDPWVAEHAAKRQRAEPHWVAQPGMNALVTHMAAPIRASGNLHLGARVSRVLKPSGTKSGGAKSNQRGWQIELVDSAGQVSVMSGFDQAILAIPSVQARELLRVSNQSAHWIHQIDDVQVAPCWTLMLAFPHVPVTTSGLSMHSSSPPLGPSWSAAYSPHPRVAWLARESSKPGREATERWTVQASAAWSTEHLEDDEDTVQAKLLKAFAEVTGIRAEPAHAQVHRWRYAKTEKPLGQAYLWDADRAIGVCGDWCIGNRVEDAFISGLELSLAML